MRQRPRQDRIIDRYEGQFALRQPSDTTVRFSVLASPVRAKPEK